MDVTTDLTYRSNCGEVQVGDKVLVRRPRLVGDISLRNRKKVSQGTVLQKVNRTFIVQLSCGAVFACRSERIVCPNIRVQRDAYSVKKAFEIIDRRDERYYHELFR